MELNKKFKALALVAGLTMGLSAFAASTVTFSPTGTPGGNITIGALDQSPGNALAIGASAGSAPGTNFNLTYQANLATANNGLGVPIYLNGSTGNFFTFVAGFRETVTGNSIVGGNGVLTFGFGANTAGVSATNFFYMYAMSAPGSDLNGTGFVGTAPILTGHFVSTNYVSSFTANGVSNPPAKLDQFGTDNYGTGTIIGAGSTTATIVIDAFSTAFFPDLVLGATTSFINTSQNLAFFQTDPSACFSLNGTSATNATCTAANNQAGVGSVGAVNGINGPNTIFQADANMSFLRAVPEPMPAALIGLGLVALALTRRKGAKKA